MAELSRASGVPVPTIKYYLREGLLRAGERTSPNQAQYDESHLNRLVLVRALIEIGGLSIAQAREILARIDQTDEGLHDVLGAAQRALGGPRSAQPADEQAAAESLAADLVTRRGWDVSTSNVGWLSLVEVLATARRLGQEDFVDLLDEYAEAMESVAGAEVAMVARAPSRDSVVERAVLGMVLGDVLLAALRRLAEEHVSSKTFRQ